VFDCDGVLLDTARTWRRAYEAALRARERRISASQLVALNGASVSRAAAELGLPADELGATLVQTLASEPLIVMPGVRKLLRRLHGDFPIAVATNSPRALVESALDRAGLVVYLDAIVSAETSRDKPAPDVYLEACRALSVAPREAVAVEDSPVGVSAARAAGLTVVYVPSNRHAAAIADLVVPDLRDRRLLNLFANGPPTASQFTSGVEASKRGVVRDEGGA
jgi:HAD superfamily hydrolase (TIGR01509 family)